jgi:hypothetical protein
LACFYFSNKLTIERNKKTKQMESIKSKKFSKMEKHIFSGQDKIIGGAHTHQHGTTHNMSSTWMGWDDDNKTETDVQCDTGAVPS